MSTELSLDIQLPSAVSAIPAEPSFRQWVLTVLDVEARLVEMTIRIVDAEESRELNHRYRGIDRPTNVLSFPFEVPPGVDCHNLGDLVICAPLVESEAREQGKEPLAHWAHLVIHGVLHLKGYDHQNERDAELMELREIHILSSLGIANPYQLKENISVNDRGVS